MQPPEVMFDVALFCRTGGGLHNDYTELQDAGEQLYTHTVQNLTKTEVLFKPNDTNK